MYNIISCTPDDAVTGCGAVDKEEVSVLKASVGELAGVVHALVEPHNGGDVVRPEVGEIVLRGVQWVTVLDTALVVRTGKR